jgi:hypothetical protein
MPSALFVHPRFCNLILNDPDTPAESIESSIFTCDGRCNLTLKPSPRKALEYDTEQNRTSPPRRPMNTATSRST